MDRWSSRGGKSHRRESEKEEDQKRKSQKKEDAGVRIGRKVAKHCVFSIVWWLRRWSGGAEQNHSLPHPSLHLHLHLRLHLYSTLHSTTTATATTPSATTTTTPAQTALLQLQLQLYTLHYIKQLRIRWPLQPLKETQFALPTRRHTTHLSYRFLSVTPCGTGMIAVYIQLYTYMNISYV